MEFTTTDGVRLHYTDQGCGPVVVLLAGIGSFSVVWQPTIDFLLQQNYRVLTLDARNQGLSEHTAQGLRISRHAMDVAELLAFLDIANFIGYRALNGRGNMVGVCQSFWHPADASLN